MIISFYNHYKTQGFIKEALNFSFSRAKICLTTKKKLLTKYSYNINLAFFKNYLSQKTIQFFK